MIQIWNEMTKLYKYDFLKRQAGVKVMEEIFQTQQLDVNVATEQRWANFVELHLMDAEICILEIIKK